MKKHTTKKASSSSPASSSQSQNKKKRPLLEEPQPSSSSSSQQQQRTNNTTNHNHGNNKSRKLLFVQHHQIVSLLGHARFKVLFGSVKIHGASIHHTHHHTHNNNNNDDGFISLCALDSYGVMEMRADHVQKPNVLGSKQEMLQLLKKNKWLLAQYNTISDLENEIPRNVNVTSIVAIVYFEAVQSLSSSSSTTTAVEQGKLKKMKMTPSSSTGSSSTGSSRGDGSLTTIDRLSLVLQWVQKLQDLKEQKSTITKNNLEQQVNEGEERDDNDDNENDVDDDDNNSRASVCKVQLETVVDGLKRVVPYSQNGGQSSSSTSSSSLNASSVLIVGHNGKHNHRSKTVPVIRYDESSLNTFDDCVARSQKNSTLMITGVQKTGKSTIVRYICNSLLSRFESSGVMLLDLDPTSPEFMTPGILSLSIVKKPLLGPSFTNMLDREAISVEKSLFFGHDTVESDIDYYVKCCMHLYTYYHTNYRSSKKNCMPLVIVSGNTLRVPGYETTLELIRLIQPNFVLKVQDGLSTAVVKQGNDHQYLDSANGVIDIHSLYPTSSLDMISHFSFQVTGPNASLSRKQFSESVSIVSVLAPRQVVKRSKEENSLSQKNQYLHQYLSYFSQGISSVATMNSMDQLLHQSDFGWSSVQQFFAQLPFYRVSWNKFVIAISNDLCKLGTREQEKILSQSMYQLNGSLVALCRMDPSTIKTAPNIDNSTLPKFMARYPENAHCLGVAYVRHICPVEHKFYLITSIEPSKLKQVNCMVSGSITLSYLFVRQASGTPCADRPYFVSGVSELDDKRLTEKVNTQETALRNKQKNQNKKTKVR